MLFPAKVEIFALLVAYKFLVCCSLYCNHMAFNLDLWPWPSHCLMCHSLTLLLSGLSCWLSWVTLTLMACPWPLLTAIWPWPLMLMSWMDLGCSGSILDLHDMTLTFVYVLLTLTFDDSAEPLQSHINIFSFFFTEAICVTKHFIL